jgi:hypothetical protein
VLEVMATSDPAKPFALVRRHRSVDGRMVDTVLGRCHTKNSAHDSLYDELHAIVIPRGSRRLSRIVTTGGSIAAVLTLAVVALVGAHGWA